VPRLFAVEPWKVVDGKLLWWPDGSLLLPAIAAIAAGIAAIGLVGNCPNSATIAVGAADP
jgi:hypothetical protein